MLQSYLLDEKGIEVFAEAVGHQATEIDKRVCGEKKVNGTNDGDTETTADF
ncbi:hypothetical protein [Anaplasma platys]|uniref:hypothetical protein n=1 Tax=Anaplasma platys TaxID=949 RepID=UPI00145E540D|nr:hypothetical protein [Anaplasma platys]